MKLFIWSENIETGAYHKDGSAFVIAESEARALELLTLLDSENPFFHWGSSARKKSAPIEITVPDTEVERVISRERGCDC